MDDPALAREAIVRERYPDSALVLLAGSVARDEATPASDLDPVIVFDRLEAARRESFETGGWPVEAFVHDPETIAWFAAEIERGPAAWTPEDLESSRYLITALPSDLEGGGSRAELTATGVELHRALARHVFGTRRRWIPKRRRLPRELGGLSSELGTRFSDAFDDLFGRDDPAAAIGLGDAMPGEDGGRRFAGFSRHAPAGWRLPFPRERR